MSEDWIRILFRYGPAALLVFLVLVGEKKARDFWREARPQKGKAGTILYFGLWGAIFAVGIVFVYVWIGINVPSCEATIRGRLIGLDAAEEVKSPFEDLYLRRVYSGKSHFDFVWRIISAKKLAPGSEVELYLDRSNPEHEDLTVYELPIASDFYDSGREVILTYDRQSRQLLLKGTSGVIELKTAKPEGLSLKTDTKAKERLGGFVAVVHAQQNEDFGGLSARLQSDDPVIRVQARFDLAKMGERALPYIQRTLTDDSSPYRLRLAAIVALNSMRNLGADPLSAQVNCRIVLAAHSSDPYLREQASEYVANHPTLDLPNHCKGPNGSECEDIRKSRINVHQIERFEGINAYFYLAGISSSDVAEIYFVNAPAGKFEDGSEIGRKTLRREMASYVAINGSALVPNSYTRKKLGRNESVELTLNGKGLRVLVLETHSFKDFVVVLSCLGAPGP